jgi:alkylation response protein AidB-like acyl-CoA dehydrogenase
MDLVVTEEQKMLQRAARDFVSGRSSLKRVRGLRDASLRGEEAFSREIWSEMARLGWLDPDLPAGMSRILLEELGRGLAPEPVLPCVVLGGGAIRLGGTDAQRSEHLPAIASGERLVALAYQESQGRYQLDRVATDAERAGSGWILGGEKHQVMGGASADWFVVVAATDEGLTLFLVPREAPGVKVTRQHRLDGRDAAIVRFEGVRLGADAALGEPDQGLALLERVIDRATIALTAEMLGVANAAFDMTLDYLKTREQFGVAIGTFQALQHRAAKLFVELELSRSAVMLAHATLDEGAGDLAIARAASLAKAKLSDVAMLVGHEAIQMHGGIGMTDEHDIGLFVKRARTAELTFGDAAHHRDRFARLDGY